MSTYESGPALGDYESGAIRQGILEATNHEGPWEFGQYIERYDGPLENGRMPEETFDSDWRPVIYEASNREEAEELHAQNRLDTGLAGPFRRSRVIRRAVSPWEVYR